MSEFKKYYKNVFSDAFKNGLTFKNDDNCGESLVRPVNSNDKELQELTSVALDQFNRNKKTYKRIRGIKNLKFFISFFFPFLSMGIANFFILKNPREQAIVPKYSLEQTMISDGKMFHEVDYNTYAVTDFEPVNEEDEFIGVDDVGTLIQYQVKNGLHSVIVTIDVDEEGQMSLRDAMSGNFYDRNADVFLDLGPEEIDAKYQEVVDDIGEFIESSSLNSTYKSEIKKLLKEDRTIIITSIVEYVKTGDISVIESMEAFKKKNFYAEVISVIVCIIADVLSYYIVIGKIKKLDIDEFGNLFIAPTNELLEPFNTTDKQKRTYIEAEIKRREKVKKLAKEYLEEDSQKYFYI